MAGDTTRRTVLRSGAVLVGGVAGEAGGATGRTTDAERWDVSTTTAHGACYLPARAYNAYQMWRDYDPAVVERDLGFAARLGRNALRVFLSYERWREDASGVGDAFAHLVRTVVENDMRVVPVLFDTVGKEPTRENLTDRDPLTATGVHSPSAAVVADESRWDEPRAYVRWFTSRYADDPRLLAIDVMNEPAVILHNSPFKEFATNRVEFARAVFETLNEDRGAVPITLGTVLLRQTQYFLDLGIDVIQFHRNFPQSRGTLRWFTGKAANTSKILDRPVWLGEWQRTRESGTGWNSGSLADGEWRPNYSSLAPTVANSSVQGSFFWSLMLKPAYLTPQRELGTLNGVFHEDGAVWRLEDARAIAAMSNTEFDGRERTEWPEWAVEVRREYLDDA